MDDVHARIGEKCKEVLIGLHLAPAALLGAGEALGDMQRVRIAEADEPRALVRQMVLTVRNRTKADQRARQLVGRRFGAPEDLCGNEVERAERGGALQQIASARQRYGFHFFSSSISERKVSISEASMPHPCA